MPDAVDGPIRVERRVEDGFEPVVTGLSSGEIFTHSPGPGEHTYRAVADGWEETRTVDETPRAVQIDVGSDTGHAKKGVVAWNRLAPSSWEHNVTSGGPEAVLEEQIYADTAMVFIPLETSYAGLIDEAKRAWRAGKLVVVGHGDNQDERSDTRRMVMEHVAVGADNPLTDESETTYGPSLEVDVAAPSQSLAVSIAASLLAGAYEDSPGGTVKNQWWGARSRLRGQARHVEAARVNTTGAENQLSDAQQGLDGWNAYDGANVSVSSSSGNTTRVVSTGGSSELKYLTGVGRAGFGVAPVYTALVENHAETPVVIGGRKDKAVVRGGERRRVRVVDHPGGLYGYEQFRLETERASQGLNVTIGRPAVHFVRPSYEASDVQGRSVRHGYGIVVDDQPGVVRPQPPVDVQARRVDGGVRASWDVFNTSGYDETVVWAGGERRSVRGGSVVFDQGVSSFRLASRDVDGEESYRVRHRVGGYDPIR